MSPDGGPRDGESEVQRYRRQIADQVHDGPQQLLTSIGMRLQMLATDVPEELEPEVTEIARQAALAREQLRELILRYDDQG